MGIPGPFDPLTLPKQNPSRVGVVAVRDVY